MSTNHIKISQDENEKWNLTFPSGYVYTPTDEQIVNKVNNIHKFRHGIWDYVSNNFNVDKIDNVEDWINNLDGDKLNKIWGRIEGSGLQSEFGGSFESFRNMYDGGANLELTTGVVNNEGYELSIAGGEVEFFKHTEGPLAGAFLHAGGKPIPPGFTIDQWYALGPAGQKQAADDYYGYEPDPYPDEEHAPFGYRYDELRETTVPRTIDDVMADASQSPAYRIANGPFQLNITYNQETSTPHKKYQDRESNINAAFRKREAMKNHISYNRDNPVFEAGPIGGEYIVDTTPGVEGGLLYISENDVDIGANYKNFYDVGKYTDDKGKVHPIVNQSDIVGTRQKSHALKIFDSTIRQYVYGEEDEDTQAPNVGNISEHSEIFSKDYMHFEGGGMDLVEGVNNKNIDLYKMYLTDDYSDAFGPNGPGENEELIDAIVGDGIRQEHEPFFDYGEDGLPGTQDKGEGDGIYNYDEEFFDGAIDVRGQMKQFADEFGPFRYAMNKAITDITTPAIMEQLKEDYTIIYNELYQGGMYGVTENEASIDALRAVIAPYIEEKLANEQVYVHDWWHQGMQESWMDYVLGITNPDISREALMFHNDGMKTFIHDFKRYLDTDQLPDPKENPSALSISPIDYMDNDKWFNAMSSKIQSRLNVLTQGGQVLDDAGIYAQKRAVFSILMTDSMVQFTPLESGSSWNEFKEMVPGHKNYGLAELFWMVEVGKMRDWYKASEQILGHSYNTIKGNISSKKLDVKLNKLFPGLGGPTLAELNNLTEEEWKKLSKSKKASKYLKTINPFSRSFMGGKLINPLSPSGAKVSLTKSAGAKLLALLEGVPIAMDTGASLAEWMMGGDWSPSNPGTRQLLGALGLFNPDYGEVGWEYDSPHTVTGFAMERIYPYNLYLLGAQALTGEWEASGRKEAELVNPSLNKGKWSIEASKQDFSQLSSDYKTIYNGISDNIVDGHNQYLYTQKNLKEMTEIIDAQILSDENYINLTNDTDKQQYYIEKFYQIAFAQYDDSNYDTFSGFKLSDGTLRPGVYQEELRKYVIAGRQYDGAINLVNSFRIGEKHTQKVLRNIPAPDGFPPELWKQLSTMASMSDSEFKALYPDALSYSENREASYYNYKYEGNYDALMSENIQAHNVDFKSENLNKFKASYRLHPFLDNYTQEFLNNENKGNPVGFDINLFKLIDGTNAASIFDESVVYGFSDLKEINALLKDFRVVAKRQEDDLKAQEANALKDIEKQIEGK